MNEIRNRIATEKFAWPGGYEMYAVTDDGGVLCFDCCRTESDCIDNAISGDGWFVAAMDHTGNVDETVSCDHCGRDIPKP